MITVYGVINSEGTHTDVSNTLLGAKQYATRNGYKKVSKRTGYNAFIVSVKTSIGWINEGSEEHKKYLETLTETKK